MDRDDLETAILNGRHADHLRNDPVLIDALNRIEKQEIEQLINCPADQLIECRANVNAVAKLRQALRAFADAGKIAERKLNATQAKG